MSSVVSDSTLPDMVVKRFIRSGATKEKRHMTAPAIQKYLSRRLELERHGGTIFARDEHTLILADTGKFTSGKNM